MKMRGTKKARSYKGSNAGKAQNPRFLGTPIKTPAVFLSIPPPDCRPLAALGSRGLRRRIRALGTSRSIGCSDGVDACSGIGYWLKSFSRDQFKLQGRTVQLSNLGSPQWAVLVLSGKYRWRCSALEHWIASST